MDDPILVELEEDDYWYRGYNMRTGERGIFPAFYAHEVVSQAREVTGRQAHREGRRKVPPPPPPSSTGSANFFLRLLSK